MMRKLSRVLVALLMTGAATIALDDQQAGAHQRDHHPSHRCSPSITALPLPTGMVNGDVLAVAGDRAAGLVSDSEAFQHAALWTRTGGGWQVRDLGDFGVTAPDEPLSATGVDRRGDIAVGISSDLFEGWLVTRSGTHQLHDFAGGTNAYVRAINADGLMVGEALDADGNDFAAVWPHWWSRPVRLAPAPGYDGSYAQGVNDRGQVVGGSFSFGALPTLAMRWSRNGTAEVLPATGDAEAMSLNDRGAVVGRALVEPSTALVWHDSREPDSLGLFADSTFSRAFSVNDRGEVVGFEGDNPPGQVPVRHLLYWPGEGPTMSLLPLSGNWGDGALTHVIAQDGTVFGSSFVNQESFLAPTMWRCAAAQAFVPTPTGPPAGYLAPPVYGLANH